MAAAVNLKTVLGLCELPEIQRLIQEYPKRQIFFQELGRRPQRGHSDRDLLIKFRSKLARLPRSIDGLTIQGKSTLIAALNNVDAEAVSHLGSVQRVERIFARAGLSHAQGHPVDSARIWLANSLFGVLITRGVPVRRSRGGLFGRILIHILFEATGKAPNDLFPLIKRTVDRMAREAAVLRKRSTYIDKNNDFLRALAQWKPRRKKRRQAHRKGGTNR